MHARRECGWGWFVSFPGRESKANDQKLKEWPQPCDTTNFCNRIHPLATKLWHCSEMTRRATRDFACHKLTYHHLFGLKAGDL
jgi:hypothetical protein